MSKSNLKNRLEYLRGLREKLCSQHDKSKDGFTAKDWVVAEIVEVREMIATPDHEYTCEEIISKLDEMLEMLTPSKETTHAG